MDKIKRVCIFMVILGLALMMSIEKDRNNVTRMTITGTEVKADNCRSCAGSGVCHGCNGAGTTNGGTMTCNSCNGTGKCSFCGGTGKG